ncbi:LRRTM4 [Branchiostoma lanceolatum]|uniref:LRRTM4 protein n=1 Tax=Branchiostoma lanceolatum TaxID=7740 RepID=A0A8J9YZV3_BRALA|nr:LRRTM4 [Branchiostoma lanceolatum]
MCRVMRLFNVFEAPPRARDPRFTSLPEDDFVESFVNDQQLFSPRCVICDAPPGHRGRDVIPTCTFVEKTPSLWLRNYRLDYLSSSDVGHLKHLQNLYIEPGNLVHLENDTFAGFRFLRRLSLRRNKLAYLGRKGLVQAYSRLDLAHNQIAHIEHEAFGVGTQGCLKTMVLLLPWNRLEVIRPGYFRHLCVLALLDLRFNRIHTIHKGSFNEAYRLRILRLAGNNLRVVTTDWFPPIEKRRLLSTLDLAQNHIQYIEPEAFMYTPLLESIGLSNNRITSLHENQFKSQYWLLPDSLETITVTLQGNPIRCTCALRWFLKSGRLFNTQSDFGLLTCSYPQDLEGTKLSTFTSAVSMQCPAPKATITAFDDGRTFRCEVCWEEGPPKLIKWTLPNDTNLEITNVSFGTGTQVNIGDVNTTTSFYMEPEGFNCCHPNFMSSNNSMSSADHCNFVGKTLSYVTISEHLVDEWLGKDVSCTVFFLSEGTNITARHNVSRPEENTQLSTSSRTVNASSSTSVLALVTFLVTALRMARERMRNRQENDNDDSLSQHEYEAVDDQPPFSHQYEVIGDDQVESDDITPYAQGTLSGIYGMDSRLPTATTTSAVARDQSRQPPLPHKHHNAASIPRGDNHGKDVPSSGYNLGAERRTKHEKRGRNSLRKGRCLACRKRTCLHRIRC